MSYAAVFCEMPKLVLATARTSRDPQRRERKLLLAIVEQALLDAKQYSTYGLSGAAVDAHHWLLQVSEEPFSFRWICRMLDVDPDAAQAWLRAGRVQ